jgi:hypothetical protein
MPLATLLNGSLGMRGTQSRDFCRPTQTGGSLLEQE